MKNRSSIIYITVHNQPKKVNLNLSQTHRMKMNTVQWNCILHEAGKSLPVKIREDGL